MPCSRMARCWWAGGLLLLPLAAHSTRFADLPATMQQQLKASPLAAPGVPVAAFQWRYEVRRAGRTKTVLETYAGASDGFSSVRIEEEKADGSTGVRDRLSVRGLFRLDPTPDPLDVDFEQLSLPPRSGKGFGLVLSREGKSMRQRCMVGPRVPASQMLAGFPGQMARVDCTGEGRYQGVGVEVATEWAWFDALGVFLMLRERVELGVLRHEETVRLLDFRQP